MHDLNCYLRQPRIKRNKLFHIQSPAFTFQPIRVIFRTGIGGMIGYIVFIFIEIRYIPAKHYINNDKTNF